MIILSISSLIVCISMVKISEKKKIKTEIVFGFFRTGNDGMTPLICSQRTSYEIYTRYERL